MDPLQWMGAVRMKVQTTDKNITIIHKTPILNRHFWTKYQSIIYINAFSNDNIPCCSVTLKSTVLDCLFISWFRRDALFTEAMVWSKKTSLWYYKHAVVWIYLWIIVIHSDGTHSLIHW